MTPMPRWCLRAVHLSQVVEDLGGATLGPLGVMKGKGSRLAAAEMNLA